MVEWSGDTEFRDLPDGRWVQLTRGLTYDFGTSGEGWGARVDVPAGFTTDFASTPRLLHAVFPPRGPWNRAAIVHDYLYRETGCSRFLADAIFRDAMASLGVPAWRRVLMYYAVRLFGWLCRPRRNDS